jgi:hypothetical protein
MQRPLHDWATGDSQRACAIVAGIVDLWCKLGLSYYGSLFADTQAQCGDLEAAIARIAYCLSLCRGPGRRPIRALPGCQRPRGLARRAPLDQPLAAIYHGEFVTAGFRSRDLRKLLHPSADSLSLDSTAWMSFIMSTTAYLPFGSGSRWNPGGAGISHRAGSVRRSCLVGDWQPQVGVGNTSAACRCRVHCRSRETQSKLFVLDVSARKCHFVTLELSVGSIVAWSSASRAMLAGGEVCRDSCATS